MPARPEDANRDEPPTLPQRAQDDTDTGWGERVEPDDEDSRYRDDEDSRYRDERPPHHRD